MGGDNLDNGGPIPDPHTFRILNMLQQIVEYCRETRRGGVPLIEDPVIRLQVGELISGVEAIKLYHFESYSAAMAESGGVGGRGRGFASQAFHKEFWPRMAQICMEIVGPLAQVQGGRWAQLEGRVQAYFRASFGNHAGGTSQLKRMSLATRGLGLPR
jgi:alkylation response protein AidB-like acyl-CoA dehydrogenase